MMQGISGWDTSNIFKTPPFFSGAPYCSVQDAVNNTYRCLRIINSTNNIQYCEFPIERFREFYDLNADGYQLNNLINTVNPDVLQSLHTELQRLSKCSNTSCSIVGLKSLQVSKSSRNKRLAAIESEKGKE